MPEGKSTADKPADASAAGAVKGDSGKAESKSGEAKSGAAKSAKSDAKGAADAKKAGDGKSDNEKTTENKQPEDAKSDDKATEEDPDVREAERERIEKQNRIKQDEYNDKVKAGQDRVKELNARFADWYYVVSDETYRKIHLGEDQIVKQKSADKPADAAVPPNPFTPKSLPAGPAKK